MASERILHEPGESDDVLTPAEADAIAAVFRRGAEQSARRYSMTLEDHRRLNASRPVTDVLRERIASPGSLIVPSSPPSPDEVYRRRANAARQAEVARARAGERPS